VKLDIPDSELMAEKLGMVVLCANCGRRLEQVGRLGTWKHEDSKLGYCSDRVSKANPSSSYAKPRKLP